MKCFPKTPSTKSCASRPRPRIKSEQDGCHEMPLFREKRESDFSLDKIDTFDQSTRTTLRYIRPLLDTAKVWRSRKNLCSSIVFSCSVLLPQSALLRLGRMMQLPPRVRKRQKLPRQQIP